MRISSPAGNRARCSSHQRQLVDSATRPCDVPRSAVAHAMDLRDGARGAHAVVAHRCGDRVGLAGCGGVGRDDAVHGACAPRHTFKRLREMASASECQAPCQTGDWCCLLRRTVWDGAGIRTLGGMGARWGGGEQCRTVQDEQRHGRLRSQKVWWREVAVVGRARDLQHTGRQRNNNGNNNKQTGARFQTPHSARPHCQLRDLWRRGGNLPG